MVAPVKRTARVRPRAGVPAAEVAPPPALVTRPTGTAGELLQRVAAAGGSLALRTVFERQHPAYREHGPRWAVLAAESLEVGGYLTSRDDGNVLDLTEKGFAAVAAVCP